MGFAPSLRLSTQQIWSYEGALTTLALRTCRLTIQGWRKSVPRPNSSVSCRWSVRPSFSAPRQRSNVCQVSKDRLPARDRWIATLATISKAENALETARQIDAAAKSLSNEILVEQFETVMPLLKELYQRL